jgi:hypothetical protein
MERQLNTMREGITRRRRTMLIPPKVTPPRPDRVPRTFPAPLRCDCLTDCRIDTWPAVKRDGEPLQPCRGLDYRSPVTKVFLLKAARQVVEPAA